MARCVIIWVQRVSFQLQVPGGGLAFLSCVTSLAPVPGLNWFVGNTLSITRHERLKKVKEPKYSEGSGNVTYLLKNLRNDLPGWTVAARLIESSPIYNID